MSLTRYRHYKPSGTVWLADVPSHWEVKRLRRGVRVNTEKTDRRQRPVALENIESWSGKFRESDGDLSGEGVAFEPGDVLFGKLRPYLAKALYADFAGEAVGDFHVLRPLAGISGRFLQYQFLNPDFISIVDGATFGAKMPRVGWDFMGDVAIVQPPLAEQLAIARFLDQETARIDKLIEAQDRLIKLLNEKRQAVISHAVTKGLNPNAPMKSSGIEWLEDIPARWTVVRLGRLFRESIATGGDELPILSVSIHDGVSDRELDESELDRKVTRSEDRSKYKAVQPGDLAYNMMRAWQGAFGAVMVAGQVSPAYVVARPTVEVRTEFVEQLLRTPKAIEQVRRHSRGITDFRLRLYWEEFKSLTIAVPPVAEQDAILAATRRESTRFDALMGEADGMIALLKERRSALISAAVTGQIDVRELAPAEIA